MLRRLAWLGSIFAVALLTLLATARVTSAPAGAPVEIAHRSTAERTVLVFVDSLSRDIATNATVMPSLERIAREGASFDVEPCRDQLTYLCLRAALTGRDESSLLAIGDNFRPNHEGPPESLLSEIAARAGSVHVLGSADFHPYRRFLRSETLLSKADETKDRILPWFEALLRKNSELIIVSLASGDMVGHAYGTASAEYRATFRQLDAVVGAIAAKLGSQANLVVFGDHGHDALGRHLPGTQSQTWAVYRGPAFRQGVRSQLHITDHRALLGVLLGVPTVPDYRGPALMSLFAEAWVQDRLEGRLPNLSAENPSAGTSLVPTLLLFGVLLVGIIATWSLGLARERIWLVPLAGIAMTLAAASGAFYNELRHLAHDHGDSPERALFLLIPLAIGSIGATLIRAVSPAAKLIATYRWYLWAATGTLLVTFFLLMPTAYYYGSRRAVILASTLSVCTIAMRRWRDSPQPLSQRIAQFVALAFAACVLLSLYPVRQLGPETAGASAWTLDASLYTTWTGWTLVVAKCVLGAILLLPRASRHSADTAGAAGLLSLSLILELTSTVLPRIAFACLSLALLLGVFALRRRAAGSLLAGTLLLLDHIYGNATVQLAAIEMILAGTAALQFAWLRFGLRGEQLKWHSVCTVAIAIYLMLWPTVGFHLAGLDFAFMFQWVPAEKYEQAWWLIGLGLTIKLALPLVLVTTVARRQLYSPATQRRLALAILTKVALLAVFILAHAARNSMSSQQATAMLSESILVAFGGCCAIAVLPVRKFRGVTEDANYSDHRTLALPAHALARRST